MYRIRFFLEIIEPELEMILNHTIFEEILATNNTVENYCTNMMPKNNLQNTKGLKRVIK